MKRQRRMYLAVLLSCLAAALAGQYYFFQLEDSFWDGALLYTIAVICLAILLSQRPAVEQERAIPFWKTLWRSVQKHAGQAWALCLTAFAVYTSIRLNEIQLNGQAVVFWVLGIVASIAAWVGLRREPIAPAQAQEPQQPEKSPTAMSAGAQDGASAAVRGGTPVEAAPIVQVDAWKGREATPARVGRAGASLRRYVHGLLYQVSANWEVLLVAGCTLAALLLRLVRLGTIPYVLSGDEGSMGLEALNALEGRLTDPFATGWLSHPTLHFFMQAGSIGLLGRNAWGLRLFSPLAGAAAIPVIYLLARRLFDRRVAIAGMVMLTVSHLHIHFSRLGINNIYDPLFGLLAFFFLVRGLQEGRVLDFALTGFSLAMAQFFYMGARLLPILVAVYIVLWMWLRRVHVKRFVLPAVAMGSTFLATGGPLFWFFALHPEDFMARVRMVGIIQMGWLQTEPLVTGKSVLELLWDQFRKSFLAFNYTLDPTSWYAAKIPYLDFVSGIVFVLGLVFVVRNWRHKGYLLVNVWFWLALIIGGVLVENPPSSPRYVIFMPAVCLIAALGLVKFLELAVELIGLSRAWAGRAMAVILLVVVILNVGYYFFQYTPSGDFGGLNTEVGMRVGEYLHDQEPGSHVYFFGPPRMWVGYATIPFLAPGLDLKDVNPYLSGPPDFVAPTGDALFVSLPERAGELEWVMRSFPHGQRREIHGHTGEVLFVVYEVRR